MSNQTFIAVHGLIRNNNKYLITKRAQSNDYMPNFWDIPGGTIEFGEKIFSALKREIKEEAKIVVKPKKILTCYGYLANKTRHQFQIVYLCDYISGKVKLNPSEHSEFRWVKLAEMKNIKKIAFLNDLYKTLTREKL